MSDSFGLKNFGVNYTCLKSGASSALLHCHSKQDEFIMVLEGTATLFLGVGDNVRYKMKAGDCMGF